MYTYDLKLFDKVVAFIREHPKQLDMNVGLTKMCNPTTHKCNTVGCFAGWGAVLAEKGTFREKIRRLVQVSNFHEFKTIFLKAIGSDRLDPAEIRFWDTLFYIEYWPEVFRRRYLNASSQRERVRAFFARTKAFRAELVKRMTPLPVVQERELPQDQAAYAEC